VLAWWLTRAARLGTALVLLAGLAGAAGDAARRESQSTFAGAAAGRVAEVVLTGPGGYPMPGPHGFDPPGPAVR
jgi:hypothetical protein